MGLMICPTEHSRPRRCMKVQLAACCLCLLAVLVMSCGDVMTRVTFVNQAQEQLVFYARSDTENALVCEGGVVAPGSSYDGHVYPYHTWLRVAATREDGQWVFDRTYQRDELEKMNMRVAVSSLEPITPPADVPVIPCGSP